MKSMVSVAMKAGTGDDPGHDAHVVMCGVEGVGENDGDEAEGGTDGQVEVLVGDDEGHADRHHRVARAVAKQGLEGVGGAEEIRIDEGPRQVEEHHHGDEAGFPAAEELHWPPAEGGRGGGHVLGIIRFGSLAKTRVARELSPLATRSEQAIEDQFSKRLPTLPTVSFVTS
jgi:hypothetical protein